MPRSVVRLPDWVTQPFDVFVNEVPQHEGTDYRVRDRTPIFDRTLKKDHVSRWRLIAGFFTAVNVYHEDDSVDVRFVANGRADVAEGLRSNPTVRG